MIEAGRRAVFEVGRLQTDASDRGAASHEEEEVVEEESEEEVVEDAAASLAEARRRLHAAREALERLGERTREKAVESAERASAAARALREISRKAEALAAPETKEKKPRRSVLAARVRLAERWQRVVVLAERGASGDVEACLDLAVEAETESAFGRAAARAFEACVGACEREAAAAGASWPGSGDARFRECVRRLSLCEARASSFAGGERIAAGLSARVVVAPIELRFRSFFEGEGALGASRPHVHARWLARVARTAAEALDDDAAEKVRAACARLARREANESLPFRDAAAAASHIDAYVDLERALGGAVREDGPLALIADRAIDCWARADAAAAGRIASAALREDSGDAVRRYRDAALLDGSSRGLASWDVASAIVSTRARYRTLPAEPRRALEDAVASAVLAAAREAFSQAVGALGSDDLAQVCWAQVKLRVAPARPRWLRVSGLARVLDDVATDLEVVDDDLLVLERVASELRSDVRAFADRLAGLATSAARAASLGRPRAAERWLGAFLDLASRDLDGTSALDACRARLRDDRLKDLLEDPNPGEALALHGIFKQRDDSRPFLDVYNLASLPRDRRAALLKAFEDLCLDDHHRDSNNNPRGGPFSSSKRRQDLDAALALLDEALDAQLRAMLAASGVEALQPRAAAAILLNSTL
ncbi:hypothetical protein CTAYLR_009174 [Chrysophaeum taylorii]|uniref:Uncharacterized protein n=1 Tax=Chrysophaeum taylorii TaxID=2483200 RepID=A0AAD7UHJ7_9STRA|nr:hypothetical protein CTAYLR_009174 [Chrysophaeum taylorii]